MLEILAVVFIDPLEAKMLTGEADTVAVQDIFVSKFNVAVADADTVPLETIVLAIVLILIAEEETVAFVAIELPAEKMPTQLLEIVAVVEIFALVDCILTLDAEADAETEK